MSSALIAGLPGCGKTRWIAAQAGRTSCRLLEWQWGQPLSSEYPLWWVVDLRCDPEIFEYVRPFLPQIDAFIGVFAEETDIMQQAAWRKKIGSEKTGGTPLFFSHYLQAPFLHQLSCGSVKHAEPPLSMPALQSFEIVLPKVVLEHLLFVLHGLEQTGARFWRVKGEVMTQEYINPVAIEGSLCGIRTYPGTQGYGKLYLKGEGLSLPSLHEALAAAVAPGEKIDIVLNPE